MQLCIEKAAYFTEAIAMSETPVSQTAFNETAKTAVDSLPLVTIVTVVYNDVENIEETLLSVIKQNYPNLEYIVIDGGSADGTVDIIKKYQDDIDYWISEKDNGIYDAMNKGIDLATGKWINFMNSNDIFYTPTTVYDVFKDFPENVDFIYGDVVHKNHGQDMYEGMRQPFDKMWKGMPFCHQALFSKTQLLKQNKFCPDNKISSDYESVLLHYINGKIFHNCNITIATRSTGGLSEDNVFLKHFERWRFARKHLNYKVDIYYLCLIPVLLLLKYCPSRITSYIMQKRYTLKPAKKVLTASTTSLVKKKRHGEH